MFWKMKYTFIPLKLGFGLRWSLSYDNNSIRYRLFNIYVDVCWLPLNAIIRDHNGDREDQKSTVGSLCKLDLSSELSSPEYKLHHIYIIASSIGVIFMFVFLFTYSSHFEKAIFMPALDLGLDIGLSVDVNQDWILYAIPITTEGWGWGVGVWGLKF